MGLGHCVIFRHVEVIAEKKVLSVFFLPANLTLAAGIWSNTLYANTAVHTHGACQFNSPSQGAVISAQGNVLYARDRYGEGICKKRRSTTLLSV